CNEQGEIIEVNDAACKNLGYTQNEFLNLTIGDIDQEYNEQEFRKFWKNEPAGKQCRYETTHKKKNGTIFPVEVCAITYLDKNIHYIAEIASDITERKNMEVRLLKSEAQLSNTMKIARLGYWEYDVTEDYFTFNDHFYSLFHTSAEEVGGYKMSSGEYAKKFVHPDDNRIISEEMTNALDTKDPHYCRQLEHRIIYSDGETGYMSVRFFIVLDDNGKTVKTFGVNQDITERKQIELESVESEKRLETILDNLQGIAYKCKNNSHWTMEYISAGCKALLGYNVDELIGNKAVSFNEIIHPDDRSKVWKEIQDALKLKKQYSVEYRIVAKDKNEKWVIDRGSGIFNDKKIVTDLEGFITEITDLKSTRLELEKSEERYRAVFNGASEGILIADKNTQKILYVNQTICTMLGYNKNELKNLGIKGLHPSDKLAATNKRFWENAYKKKAAIHSIPCIKRDKSIIYTDISSFPALIDNRESTVAFFTDVTEKIQRELELNKLSRAVNQAPVLIIITDKEGKTEYVNPKFTEVTGYTFEEVRGQIPDFLKSGTYAQSIHKEIWKTILSGKVWNGELVNRKKNDELFWESAFISPVTNSEGEITHFVAIKEDITEKKKTEFELIRAKEKAEESDRLKSAFLANMSHEIRTPMNGIIGFSSLLSSKDLSEENTEYYKGLITKSANQLLTIVSNIIEISKIESDQVQANLNPVNMKALLNDVSLPFKKDAEKKGLVFKLNIRLTNENATIVTDNTKIRQIVTNLLNNALKFTKTGFIELGAGYRNKELQIYVKDTGIGISKNMHDKMFQRFRQAEETHTREYGGTGLGLSISKAYVELLGGRIWINSEKGKGATFYFALPVVKYKSKKTEKNAEQNNAVTMETDWSDYTILIADDEPLVIDYFREVLDQTNIKMHFAVRGKQAISIVEEHEDINLVLLDIRMPEMNGFEVFKRIKALRPDLPVIAQTAYAYSDDRDEILNTGFDDYISKPMSNHQVLEKINDFLK
ncbi:MAG: PAS domain S-box protein, partial [Bacteroidales bacterium]